MTLPPRTLALFNYDWDRLGFARWAHEYPVVSAGFDLFRFPSNARLIGFDLERFVESLAARATRNDWRAVISNHEQFGALAAALLGIDALVFTAGIGENARTLRARICEGLSFLGIAIDPARNAANDREISSPGAATRVLVRSTDEEAMIVRHALHLLRRSKST